MLAETVLQKLCLLVIGLVATITPEAGVRILLPDAHQFLAATGGLVVYRVKKKCPDQCTVLLLITRLSHRNRCYRAYRELLSVHGIL